MQKISLKEFQFRHPSFPNPDSTSEFYMGVANSLLSILENDDTFPDLPEGVAKRVALGLTAYLQDIVSDAGVWRSFIDANRKLYGYSIPFHCEGEQYVDYELNVEDVRFLTWYTMAMVYEDMRQLYPHDIRVLKLADKFHEYLLSVYDDAPNPEGFNLAHGLEFNDPEDSEQIYHLGHWLFLHCYLLTPAFALTMSEIMSDPAMMKADDMTALQNRIEQSMMEDPTGPLALFIPEWLQLIIEGKLPHEVKRKNTKSKEKEEEKNHPYYTAFVAANDGKVIKYFENYQEMNRFFIEKMGWDKDQEHLPMMKNEKYFVAMVNPKRGMLIARNVAKCIADPENPYYDKDFARENAFNMLTVRGKCPADLVKFACSNGWLPEAVFPGTDDHKLVAANWDFIARCYLQQYYRD